MSPKRAFPDAESVVLSRLLVRNAQEVPSGRAIVFEDGRIWTWAECVVVMQHAARTLAEAGLVKGDRVAFMMGNSPAMLAAWWGANALGLVMVPLNVSSKGAMLDDAIALTEPSAFLADAAYIDRLVKVARGGKVIGSDSFVVEPSSIGALSDELPTPEPWDTHALLFTSGTTGPSKASITSHNQSYLTGSWFMEGWDVSGKDTFLLDLPLFHGAALSLAHAAIGVRCALALRSAPSLSNYWGVAREVGATVSVLISSMAAILTAKPASPDDRDHPIRKMLAAPLPANIDEFVDRFGIEGVGTTFGGTEVSGALVRLPHDELVPGFCGRIRAGYEVRLVDDNDMEVPVGEPGEAIVRTDHPWSLSGGYVGNPEATAAAWRNGWFHTGDVLRRDEAGNYFFVDRKKDAMRRRGENISSWEVEREVASYPAIAEAACVAHPSDQSVDDEVKVFVVIKPGHEFSARDLVLYLADQMPHYMVPRFVEPIDELPKTATGRAQKHLLRERGNGQNCWDSEREGLRITRHGVSGIEAKASA